MKNLFIYALMINVVSILYACKEDEQTAKKIISNSFEYEGNSYELSNGYVYYEDGLPGGGRLWNVSLTSSSITLSENEGLIGIGNYVKLELIAPINRGNVLPEGKYIMSDLEDIQVLYAIVGVDYAPDKEVGDIKLGLSASTVKEMEVDVSKSDDSFIIEFGITLKDGNKKINGEFSGHLIEW